ncbi:SLC13 family permease [Rubrivirga sp. IMCC43871]|uniref:SLC13 family permease n=1 Tax=Rubrivirga sp. IMCC43871 TaxID=3391575 RepID=UPI00398FFB67
MSWQAWYTLGALALMVAALVRGVARVDMVLLGTLGLLLLAGIVGPAEAFAGFANPAVVAIASLFVVAAGVDRTGALGFLDGLLRPRSTQPGPAVARIMGPTALLSGVLNNTPIVAMLIPRVQAWHRTGGTPPASKLLIPLSTAAIVGGWLTLIGTSTNVVVHGLLQAEGLPGFGFFTLAWVGVPAVVAVVLYYALIGHRLLPANEAVSDADARRGYHFELAVADDAPFAGATVEASGFRTLGDAYLARILRDGRAQDAAPESTVLPGDVLAFVGDTAALDELLARPGLVRTTPTPEAEDLPLFEVVVAAGSRLEGRTLREVGFRERYGGVVLALRRRAHDVTGGLGRVPLRAGDLLLVEGRNTLAARLGALADDFALVSPVGAARVVSRRAPVALALLAGAIGLTAFGVLPLATAAFCAALGMVATGCLRGQGLRRAIDVPVLLVIGAALGIGAAVEVTGLSQLAAAGIERVSPFGPVATLAVVYLLSNGLAELITNKASAVLMLPVALAVAADLGVSWLPFAVAVTIASAASFLTPIGYQTNLMVMAAGRYRYTDFARAGLPVSLIVFAVTMTVCVVAWL